jgi:hypothetical protein
VALNIENSKRSTPDIKDLNQNNLDDVTPHIENSKQHTPDITDLNQNIPGYVTPSIVNSSNLYQI